MRAFAKRNLKLYLRDRSSLVLSLLTVFIVIGLYVLFLKNTIGLGEITDGDELKDNWVMAGILSITSMTTTLGMLGTMVNDKVCGIEKDFYVAPVKRWKMGAGYMAGAYLVGVIMSFIALCVAEIYIVANGGQSLGPLAFMQTLLAILLTSLMNTSIALFLVTLFKSFNAYATANVVLGTLIGFLTGIYVPIGSFPEAVQWIIKLFPVSHGALVFRNIMMGSVMERAFEGVPVSMAEEIKEELGVLYMFGDKEITVTHSVAVMAVTAVIFFGAACFNLSRKNRH